MTRVFATGGTGFVGSRVLHALLERGFEILALARTPSPNRRDDVRWLEGDLLDPASYSAALRSFRPDVAIHLAWEATPGLYRSSPSNGTHLHASLRLFEELIRLDVARVVVAGSCSERAASDPILAGRLDLYTVCKRALLDVGQSLLAGRLAWGRIFYPYGAGAHPSRLFGAVQAAVSQGETFHLRSDGHHVRDFVHVDDVASAFGVLVGATESGVFDIGTGYGRTLGDAVRVVAASVGDPSLVRFGDDPLAEEDVLVADPGRLHALGWQPSHDLENDFPRRVP